MPFDDQVVHILTLQCREAVQCEVIQDEQIWDEEAAEDAFVRVVGTRLAELFEQRVGAREQHTVAGSDGGGAERLDQKCFSDVDWTNQDDVLLTLEELERKDVLELLTVDVHR